MFGKKKPLFGKNIPHSCDYCQNCVVEGEKNFCKYRKSVNKNGRCSKFSYNPTMRKVSPLKTVEKFSPEDFEL
ncbi:MAG: hypothetical protein Q4D44_08125 [Eubacteriales bacterium]|nr:hypothetical protein [Eubacteriales bacterium]